jgi:hypothetical protein
MLHWEHYKNNQFCFQNYNQSRIHFVFSKKYNHFGFISIFLNINPFNFKKSLFQNLQMRELITIQLGHESNFVGNHYWNTSAMYYQLNQESLFDQETLYRLSELQVFLVLM